MGADGARDTGGLWRHGRRRARVRPEDLGRYYTFRLGITAAIANEATMNKKVRRLYSDVQPRHKVVDLPTSHGVPVDQWRGMVLGVLVGFTSDGCPLVDFPNNPAERRLEARHTIELAASDAGRQVTIMFAQSDPVQPVITGILQDSKTTEGALKRDLRVQIDSETFAFTAKQQLILECGKCKITLTRDGRITIRGVEILSRASGTQRIRGGSIQLN